MTDYLNQAFDSITNPQVAVPTVAVGGAANAFIDHLPMLINCGMAVYVVLLVGHKAWTWYTEFKDRKNGRKK